MIDNLTWARGNHLMTFGGGILIRGISGVLTASRDGQYGYASMADFLRDKPNAYRVGLDRLALPSLIVPDFHCRAP